MKKVKKIKIEVSNGDLFLYALYLLGGAGRYVDIEDVFMEMWQKAPTRFSWRKYKQPNYQIMRKSIIDIGQRGDGDLLLGEGQIRQLSAKGVKWVEKRLNIFEQVTSGKNGAVSKRRPSQKLIVEFSKAAQIEAFIQGKKIELDRNEIAHLLRCAPDAPLSVWQERLETLRSAATDAGRTEILKFLNYLKNKKPKWFGVS